MNTIEPKPRRRRLRLTLGAMMIAVLAIGCVLGWVVHRAHVQRDAVAAIKTLRRGTRGVVYYDWQMPGGKLDKNGKPRGPKWLRDALGPDVFDTVVFVGIQGENVDDEILRNVARLSGVEMIDIQGGPAPDLTSSGMARLRSLTRMKLLTVRGFEDAHGLVAALTGKTGLRHLLLQQIAVTDEEMAVIGGLTGLEELFVDGRNVTDRGFVHVSNLRKLTTLDMPGVNITTLDPVAGLVQLDSLGLGPRPTRDPASAVPKSEGPASLEPLRRLTKLTELSLMITRIDDRELSVVGELPRLQSFRIGGTGITEAGLVRLAGSRRPYSRLGLNRTSISDLRPLTPHLNTLQYFLVWDSPVTDEGIAALSNAIKLKTLIINGTKLTDAGLAHLSSLTSLTHLFLDRSDITDAGLATLKPLKSLRSLSLSETKVTDASIPILAGFPSLRLLFVYQSGISPEGIERLRKAMPKAQIISAPRARAAQ